MTRWCGGVLAVVGLTVPVAAQEKPEAIITRAVEAAGGLEPFKKFPASTSEATGRMYLNGAVVPFSTKTAAFRPGRSRLEITFEPPGGPKTTVVQVVNGDTVTQTQDGNRLDLSDVVKDHARQSARWGEVLQLQPLLNPDRYTLTLGKDVTLGGRRHAVVKVKAEGMPDATLYFDRSTGRLTHTRRTTRNMAEESVVEYTTRSDFKKIDGVVVPMKTATTHNGRPYLESTVTKFALLEKLDESLFDTK